MSLLELALSFNLCCYLKLYNTLWDLYVTNFTFFESDILAREEVTASAR
jgi:hypothetical protein